MVTADIDPGAVEDLIALCARYHQIRTAVPDPTADPVAGSRPQTARPSQPG